MSALDYAGRVLQISAKVYWEYKPLWTPRRLTTSLDDIDIDRPIFVVGVQGGGLTLLTRMMHRNEDIVTIGGGPAFWTGNNEIDKHSVREMPKALSLASPGFQSPTFKDHVGRCREEHEVFGLERCWVYATDEMYDRYRKTEADYTDEIATVTRTRVKEALRAYARDQAQARFLDMSQSFSLRLPLLCEIFPQAQIIVQVRDPYVLCWREATSEGYGYWSEKPSFEERLSLAAQHWRNTYRTIRKDLNDLSKETVTIQFEELIAEPQTELRRATDHAQIAYHDDMVPREHHTLPLGSGETFKWYPIRSDVNQKYKEEMTPEARSIVEAELEGIGETFGYLR